MEEKSVEYLERELKINNLIKKSEALEKLLLKF